MEEMSPLGIHHTPWWKEMRASRRIFRGVEETDNDSQVLHYASWQVAAFWLPATQEEASWWWDAPPWIGGLCPKEFMPGTDDPSPKNFWVMRQEKTLAMAQALQACAEESGAPIGTCATLCRNLEVFGTPYDSQWG